MYDYYQYSVQKGLPNTKLVDKWLFFFLGCFNNDLNLKVSFLCYCFYANWIDINTKLVDKWLFFFFMLYFGHLSLVELHANHTLFLL